MSVRRAKRLLKTNRIVGFSEANAWRAGARQLKRQAGRRPLTQEDGSIEEGNKYGREKPGPSCNVRQCSAVLRGLVGLAGWFDGVKIVTYLPVGIHLSCISEDCSPLSFQFWWIEWVMVEHAKYHLQLLFHPFLLPLLLKEGFSISRVMKYELNVLFSVIRKLSCRLLLRRKKDEWIRDVVLCSTDKQWPKC